MCVRALLRFASPLETIEMPWGTQFVPVDELERLVASATAASSCTERPIGRRPTLPDDVARRIVADQHVGKSLGQIARDLNADGVPTAQGGAQWWPSTVRGHAEPHRERNSEARRVLT